MPLGKHRRDHQKLGVPAFGNLITVGAGGQLSDLADIADNVVAPVLLDTFTGSSVAEVGSGLINRITDDAAGLISGVVSGQTIGIRIGGAGNPILVGAVLTRSAGTIRLVNNLFGAVVSEQVDIYQITNNGVFILPGSNIELTTTVANLPSFTTLYAIPNSVRLYTEIDNILLSLGEDTNEINFWGLKLGLDNTGAQAIPLKLPAGAADSHLHSCDFRVDMCNFQTRGDDGIFFPSNNPNGPGIHVHNNIFSGYYDNIRLAQHREANIENNLFYNHGLGLASIEQAAVAVGALTNVEDLPREVYNINYNRVIADGQELGGTSTEVKGVEIRGELGNNAIVDIKSNNIQCEAHTAGGGDAVCIKVGAGGVNTPTINASNNTLVATQHGTANAYTMHSTNVNYVINRHSNIQVAGILGSNTAAAVTV